MDFYEIKPYVRYAESVTDAQCIGDVAVVSYDHVALYTSMGSCEVLADGKVYTLNKGRVIIIKPGSSYCITASSDFEGVSLHFDYDSNNEVDKGFYMKPVAAVNFRPGKIINVDIQPDVAFNENLCVSGCNHLDEHFKAILAEFSTREKYSEIRMSARMILILTEISRICSDIAYDDADKTGSEVIDDIIEYIHENYNKDITNKIIADKFNFHSKYINILIKNKTGYSLHKYIIMRRISKSIEYLQNTGMHIYEIAEKVGFADPCYFTKCFKQVMGANPKSFRVK